MNILGDPHIEMRQSFTCISAVGIPRPEEPMRNGLMLAISPQPLVPCTHPLLETHHMMHPVQFGNDTCAQNLQLALYESIYCINL